MAPVAVALLLAVRAAPAAAEPEPADQPAAADDDAEPVTDSAGEVIVVSGKAPNTTEAVTYEMTPDVIRRVPGSGNDALKSLQTIPGVGRVPYGMGGLILRGTSPRDSNVYLDGIEVPLLYHFGGLASFYPSALLSSLELTPGGYSVEYGRGQGGLATLTSRAGRRDHWRVASEVSMIDASLRADGPAGARSGWSMALRRSYVDAVLPLLGGDQEMTNAPRYWDGQLRYDVDLWSGGRITALMFGSDDQIGLRYGVDQDKLFRFRTRFARLGLRFRQRGRDTTVELLPWIGTERYNLVSTFQSMTSSNTPVGARGRITHRLHGGQVSAGVDLSGGDFSVASLTISDDTMTEIQRASRFADGALWTEGVWRLAGGRVSIEPGVRAEHYGLADAWIFDPRLVMNEQVAPRVGLRQSVGVFHQGPGVADSLWGNDDLGPSYSIQSSAGATVDIGGGVSLAAAGFFSSLHDLAVDDPNADDAMLNNLDTYKIGAIASSREFIAAQFGTFSKLANIGRGRSYGAELLARYVGARGFAWVAYTYSRSRRRIGDMPWERWVLNQPHVLTVLGSVVVGGTWHLGARFRYASGNPITPLIGRTLDANDEWQPIFGAPFSDRLPGFVQLDLRVDRDWIRRWGTITVFLDVQNATRRDNVEGRVYEDDYSGFESTKGLPLFPSFGLSYTPR